MDSVVKSPYIDAKTDALYGAQLSYKYHSKREYFFSVADRIDKVATLALGTVAFTKIAPAGIQDYLGWAFGVVAIIALVFNFSERARQHNELATAFKMLEIKIEEVGISELSEKVVNQWKAEHLKIEINEPPVLCALVRICQNEMAGSKGAWTTIYPLKWYQRLFAYFWQFSESFNGAAE
jgi:hypothetical protein